MTKKQNTPQQEEKEKRMLLWSGITFFMVLILSLWMFNIQNVIQGISERHDTTKISDNLEGAEKWNEEIEDVKKELKNMQPLKNSTTSSKKGSNNDNAQKNFSPGERLLKQIQGKINQ